MTDDALFAIIDDHEDVWDHAITARLYGGFVNADNDIAPLVATACAIQWLADRADVRICTGCLSGNYAVDVSGVLIERPTLIEALYAAVRAIKQDIKARQDEGDHP